jgi:hypothetical protein
MKGLLKSAAALALGGAFNALGSAAIDGTHLGTSLGKAGVLALTGAVTALVGLHTRAPKDHK